MLNGTMVHEVFQKAAVAKDFSLETLSKLADQALCSPQHLGLMCVLCTYASSHFHHLFCLFSCAAVQQLCMTHPVNAAEHCRMQFFLSPGQWNVA